MVRSYAEKKYGVSKIPDVDARGCLSAELSLLGVANKSKPDLCILRRLCLSIVRVAVLSKLGRPVHNTKYIANSCNSMGLLLLAVALQAVVLL